jgi:hypothetical protein
VVCGDFNNGPQSAIYSYMSESFMQTGLRSAMDTYRAQAGEHGAQFEPEFTAVNYKRAVRDAFLLLLMKKVDDRLHFPLVCACLCREIMSSNSCRLPEG